MKKIFIVLICFSLLVFTTIKVGAFFSFPGGGGGDAATGCAAIYADTQFCMDFDHPSGTDYLYLTNGTGIQATADVGTVVISTSYGENGTNGMYIDLNDAPADQYLAWTGRSDEIDENGAQTICVRFKSNGAITDHAGLVGLTEDAANPYDGNDDKIYFYHQNADGDLVLFYYVETGTDQYMADADHDNTTWETIGASWNKTDANEVYSINCGDATFATNWTEVDELADDMTGTPQTILIGDWLSGEVSGVSYQISQVALFDGYQVDCTQYSGF